MFLPLECVSCSLPNQREPEELWPVVQQTDLLATNWSSGRGWRGAVPAAYSAGWGSHKSRSLR